MRRKEKEEHKCKKTFYAIGANIYISQWVDNVYHCLSLEGGGISTDVMTTLLAKQNEFKWKASEIIHYDLSGAIITILRQQALPYINATHHTFS